MTNNDYVDLILEELYARAAFEADDCNNNLYTWATLSRALSLERANRAAARAPMIDDSDLGEAPYETRRQVGV